MLSDDRWYRGRMQKGWAGWVLPESPSCERVFALLKNMFNEQQMSSLKGYVQAALMLRYNGRQLG